MAMLMHSNHLESEYKAGPHTISVPRLRPADQSEVRDPAAQGRAALEGQGACPGDCLTSEGGGAGSWRLPAGHCAHQRQSGAVRTGPAVPSAPATGTLEALTRPCQACQTLQKPLSDPCPSPAPSTPSQVSIAPPYEVDDANFKKLVAILRIAVPYTGMILSTR